ncbi:UNVERIFIED_CONTAM: hypothetical protein Scaly_2990300 [Sesamum calycinum]|uniref:Uncharacterized protein n=1 Tax=Sesamum calycinum TaxID=2727403 RepID=A0AAW2KEC3_9LAMI
MCNDGDSTFILGLAAGLASLPSRLECSLPAEDRNVRNHSMGGRLILLPPQGWLIVRSRLEDPWFWKAHESERYVECATDTTLRSGEYPESHVRQLNTPRGRGTEGPSRAQDSLAALTRRFGFLSGGHFPYLTPATLSLQATPAEQDALRFPLLWTHRSMTRDGKRKTFFSGELSLVKPKDAPRQGQTVGKRTGSIEPGWIRAGIVAPIQHQFRKGSLMLEGASPLSDRPLVHANPKKLSRTSHMQGNLHVWFWPGFPETLLVVILILRGERKKRIYRLVETLYVVVYLGRSIYIFPLGLCLDLLCAKSKRLVPMEIPLGLIPRLMTKVESAWRKVKIGGVEKFPSGYSEGVT